MEPARFQDRLAAANLWPLRARGIDVFQVNVGKLCNQTCAHCHVDAGPTRREIMTWETMELCLAALEHLPAGVTVDITGGAPELNPSFRRFVEAVRAQGKSVMARCNLTVLLANPSYADLPEFYARHRVTVTSSLPHYDAAMTDRQRGAGVFDKSIAALRLLNAQGYGKAGTGLVLNLVHNPVGAFLPAAQADLEADFRRALAQHGVEFNQLFCITNMPISRYREYLERTGNFEPYMDRLSAAFNPAAATNVMCRNLVSVGWDGALYDCDFNQMLEMKMGAAYPRHVGEFDAAKLAAREIVVGRHCFGCTAGAGSSCGGEVV